MATRSERLDLRLTPEHKDLIEKAARARGLPVTGFVLGSALDRARETLEREQHTLLTGKDWALFVREVESDDPPAPALERAVKRTRRGRG